MTRISIMFIGFLFSLSVKGQSTKKVLFIGNSYTAVNNLPFLVSAMATNTGDVLIYDSNTPGGYRFMNHATNATTLNKINSNNWDYVVLQAQSQEAAFSQTQMNNEVFPYATTLSNAIRLNYECSQPLFYMTWGRQNGDPSNCPYIPWVCTYEGMDDVIRNSYISMAEQNDAEVSPVGAVWRDLRQNNPTINLYSLDESHPSMAGSYAAACAFYTMIYKKDPTLMTWNSTLSDSESTAIKMAAKTIVFDQIPMWDYTINPAEAGFSENIQAGEVVFTSTTSDFDTVFWDFGDGTSSTELNPVHTYTANGLYVVSMKVTKCGKSATISKTLEINTDLNQNQFDLIGKITVFPNPTLNRFRVNLNGTFEKCAAVIFDVNGTKLLMQEMSTIATFEMDLSALSSGIYILKITADQNAYYSKVVKR